MRMLLVVTGVITLCVTSWIDTSPAQNPTNAEKSPADQSIEMWYYKQVMDRYDDPSKSVRRRAEFVRTQRQARIAAMNWYGFSNSRPTASPTPSLSMYSPAWQADRLRPYAWYSTGRPTVVVGPGYHVYW